MPWRGKEVIIGTNIFGLILSSKENLVHKVPGTGDLAKSDRVILEFVLSWEGYSLHSYSRF